MKLTLYAKLPEGINTSLIIGVDIDDEILKQAVNVIISD